MSNTHAQQKHNITNTAIIHGNITTNTDNSLLSTHTAVICLVMFGCFVGMPDGLSDELLDCCFIPSVVEAILQMEYSMVSNLVVLTKNDLELLMHQLVLNLVLVLAL